MECLEYIIEFSHVFLKIALLKIVITIIQEVFVTFAT